MNGLSNLTLAQWTAIASFLGEADAEVAAVFTQHAPELAALRAHFTVLVASMSRADAASKAARIVMTEIKRAAKLY